MSTDVSKLYTVLIGNWIQLIWRGIKVGSLPGRKLAVGFKITDHPAIQLLLFQELLAHVLIGLEADLMP